MKDHSRMFEAPTSCSSTTQKYLDMKNDNPLTAKACFTARVVSAMSFHIYHRAFNQSVKVYTIPETFPALTFSHLNAICEFMQRSYHFYLHCAQHNPGCFHLLFTTAEHRCSTIMSLNSRCQTTHRQKKKKTLNYLNFM